MKKTALAYAVGLSTLSAGLVTSTATRAEFFEDSKASLQMRNFYMGRDYRQDDSGRQPAVPGSGRMSEWAQGFILRYESGFTEGPVGFGVDAIGTLGIKLDSGRGSSGTGLLLRDAETKRAQDSYGDLHAAAKIRYSKTTLRLGSYDKRLPMLQGNDSRLLPTVFQGTMVHSQEIAGLDLDAGRISRVNARDSQDYEALSVTSGNRRNIKVSDGNESTEFNIAQSAYRWNDQLSTTLALGELQGLYRQTMLNALHTLPLGDKRSLVTDIRYARSTDDGNSNVDNNAFGIMSTYKIGFHAVGLGYQAMTGETGFAYLGGTDPFLLNFVQVNDFANKDEKSWQVRYDYNFTGIGLPGLTFMTRYLSGDNVDLGASRSEGREWERDIDIAYFVQDGPLKNVSLRWRNAATRSNFANSTDENRLILSYSLPIW
ncbi:MULTISPECIES: OprD family porin [Pseudomonas]|uniref:OprD family porin n=1 Tax=Pseudomonas TaxID=286 RepID=UPI000356F2FD|nr:MULTISPECIES: OprD family porin [Pseudomonas]OKP70150.1 porin [Pseudomonas fluorescens]EPJ76123.1 putative porin [Pseudomonas sp. CFT9]MCF5516785.1 outer membrane porin, OprD family [Pseudomonas sp. PA-3-6E]MCF5560839.1 outer membrane porin, OprD family [Pseudomonas sp. PA-3-5D]MCF5593146.1 outer membrane porin, OprD family [Pseudomonas sp. PA-3-10C]